MRRAGRKDQGLGHKEKDERFGRLMLPHMDAAFNLACWLTRDAEDARDVVQESYLRAYKFFDSFHGDDGRAWLLAIVRNTCFTLHRKNNVPHQVEEFDEEIHVPGAVEPGVSTVANPETALMERANRELVNRAIEALPREFREVIVLRELEGLSYKQIAAVVNIPIGTVMSRLARGRCMIQRSVAGRARKEGAE